jgi:hypothetical protein
MVRGRSARNYIKCLVTFRSNVMSSLVSAVMLLNINISEKRYVFMYLHSNKGPLVKNEVIRET